MKWVWYIPNLLASFRVYIKISDKLLVKFCFGNSWRFLRFCSLYMIFGPKNLSKVIIGLWKKCDIKLMYFYCLKYMLRVFWLLFNSFCHICKKSLGNVQFSRCFIPEETPENCHSSLKWVWDPPSFLAFFRVYIKIVI